MFSSMLSTVVSAEACDAAWRVAEQYNRTRGKTPRGIERSSPSAAQFGINCFER